MSAGHSDPYVPEKGPDGLRHWQVATGVIYDTNDSVLLVQNKRRNAETDWSTPGGVVDPGEDAVQGLTREVSEETGLEVRSWTNPLYSIEVVAPGYGFFLRVDAFRSLDHRGDLRIDDPDGIVVAAEFFATEAAVERLGDAPRWVAEPLSEYLEDPFEEHRVFAYDLAGTTRENQQVTRRP